MGSRPERGAFGNARGKPDKQRRNRLNRENDPRYQAAMEEARAMNEMVDRLAAQTPKQAEVSAAARRSSLVFERPIVPIRRVGKIYVETGELSDAIEGFTSENPRKGFYKNGSDVIKELLDCASAALCAVEYLTGDFGISLDMLIEHVEGNRERLESALGSGT